ncbi:MAG TPA: hypothetical protein VNP89_04915 [Gaiellaceae bacterium]|nr:hypothetical protein [Gaiellaceae bacterium]
MRGLLLGAVAGVAILSGCGAHAVEDPPSLDQIAAATRSDSYRFETSMGSEGIDNAFTGTATGAADPAKRRGVIRYRFDGPDEEELEMEVRRIGDDTYTRYSGEGSVFEDGWSKEPTSEADELTGPFGAFSEPHRAADALAQHGRDVETGPGERIDGVSTTVYHATVPTIELLGGGATKARRDELEKEIRETDSESAEVEASAGADGLLRRLELQIPITEEGDTGHFRISMRFFDFGKPVDVEAPPASERQAIPVPGGNGEPCGYAARPHTAEEVIDALRADGFIVTPTCLYEETTIAAVDESDDSNDTFVVCVVAQGPEPPKEEDMDLFDDNVSCAAPAAQRPRVRTILDRL